MIGRELFEMMKDDAVLVNTARSGLLDEPALAEALKAGKLWGAGIDASRAPNEQEAFRETFRGNDNVILTPHIASVSNNAFNKFNEQITDNLARITNEEKPYYLLNDVWKM